MSLFHFKPEEYPRNLDILPEYQKAVAQYMSVVKGIPYEQALSRAKEVISADGPVKPFDPRMKTLFRPAALSDREHKVMRFSQYIQGIKGGDLIVGPNMVVYENPKVSRAYEADMIDYNLIERKKVKKAGQLAKTRGDEDTANAKDEEQNNKKTLNNSLSGACGSPHNPHYCASAHTTLTSTCRTLTSNSNSITERFMAGNRHYYSAEITLENLVACVRLTDQALIQEVMTHFELQYPSIEYALERIKKCCDMYFTNTEGWVRIERFLRTLNKDQLASVMFTMDLRSWVDINPTFTRRLIDSLTLKYETVTPLEFEEAKAVIGSADDYLVSFVMTLSSHETDYIALGDLKDKKPEVYCKIAYRMKRVKELVKGKYWKWIRAFLVTELMPQSIHSFPSSIRRAVIGSDTDSTLFTTQELIEWYFGKIVFNKEADCVREFVTYFNSQIVCHVLAKISKYMGAQDSDLFRLMMKPEFAFPIMAFTNRMKHYYAAKSAVEGNLYKELDMEIKGVALKSSKVSPWVIKISNQYIETIVERFMQTKAMTPMEVIAPIAYLEHRALHDLENGLANALYSANIKEPQAYAQGEENATYKYYQLWEEVFAPKYGSMGPLPVAAKKVSVNLKNRTAVAEWISKLDPDIGGRLAKYVERTGRKDFTMFLVPAEFLKNNPIPKEIWAVFNRQKFLNTMMDSFYYVLETLGLYTRNDKLTRFAYEEMPYDIARAALPFDVESMIPSDANYFDESRGEEDSAEEDDESDL